MVGGNGGGGGGGGFQKVCLTWGGGGGGRVGGGGGGAGGGPPPPPTRSPLSFAHLVHVPRSLSPLLPPPTPDQKHMVDQRFICGADNRRMSPSRQGSDDAFPVSQTRLRYTCKN